MATKKVRKINKRKNPRRKYNRKYKNKYNKATITRVKGQGIPDSIYVKLVYCEQIDISALAVSYMPYVFRGNSLHDPNYSGVGHQPLYFDQYAAMYSKYRVLGSAVKLDVINNSPTSALFYVCEPNTDLSSITDISTLYEQARAGAPKLVPIAARIASRMKKYCSTRKVCGLTKAQVYDDTFASSVVTSPTNVWYWNLLFGSIDAETIPVGHFMIKITYYVQFFDRNLVAQS